MCIAEITPAPKGRNSIKASPTNCYCEHTHVCCRMDHLELHPRIKSYKGLPDQLLQRAYTCALQNKSYQCCTQGSSCYKGSADRLLLARTCVLQNVKNSGFHPRINGYYKALADHLLLRAHTNVLQILTMQSCTEGQGLRRRGRPNSAGSIHVCVAKQTNSRLHPRSKAGHVLLQGHTIVRAHKPCRIDQTRVEPTDQGLQRFGRATDDVSIHMCVAE